MIDIYCMVVSTLFVFATAWIDAQHHIDKDYIENHNSRMVQRSMFFTVCFLVSINCGIYSLFIFWLLFDGIRNIMVGENWFYLGSVASTDVLFLKKFKIQIRKHEIIINMFYLYLVSKLISLFVCLYLIIELIYGIF